MVHCWIIAHIPEDCKLAIQWNVDKNHLIMFVGNVLQYISNHICVVINCVCKKIKSKEIIHLKLGSTDKVC